MNNDETLLDSVYVKIKTGEPPSIIDLQRWVDFVLRTIPMPVSVANEDEIFGTYNKLLAGLQDKLTKQQ